MDDVILGTFVACVVGGILPWVNTEVAVTGAALLVAPTELVLLVVAAAGGHVLSKTSVYALARWAPRHLPAKAREALARTDRLREAGWPAALAILVSSAAGLPPFFLTTLAAGAMRIPVALFVCAGLVGTALRYAVLAGGAALVASGLHAGTF